MKEGHAPAKMCHSLFFLFCWLPSACWGRQVPECHGPCWPFLPHPSHAVLPRLLEFGSRVLSDLEFSMQLLSLPQRLSLSTFTSRLNSSITYDRPSQPVGLSWVPLFSFFISLAFLVPLGPSAYPPYTLDPLIMWLSASLSLPNCHV